MTTKIEELSGRPIEGEIQPTKRSIPVQDDPMEVIKALDTLLALPGVIEYKWTQYTPYWNDGEECEFSTLIDWNAGVKLEFGDSDGGEQYDGYYTNFRTWVRAENFSRGRFEEIRELNGVATAPYAEALREVNRLIGGSAHDLWLKETFGDHATVIATKEGFRVEFFEHD